VTFQSVVRLTGVSLSLLVSATAAAAPEKPLKPARLYTNDDLDRVHALRGETGVLSLPAAGAAAAERASRHPEPAPGHGEAYWRREAGRVRERLRALEERAASLRAQIAERTSASESFGRRRTPSGSSASASLRASLAAVERRARLTQDDLEERARRDGALPGWLR
jgi:hypothetical protein